MTSRLDRLQLITTFLAVAEAGNLSESAVREMLGIPVGTRRTKCALLCLHTLKNALRVHEGKDTQSWAETVGNAEETR